MLAVRKIHISFVMMFSVFLVIGFLAANSLSQSDPEPPKEEEKPKEVEIPVKEDAEKNGYKLYLDNKSLYFQIVNVENPETLKIVDGKVKMKYLCEKHKKPDKSHKTEKSDNPYLSTDIMLSNGGTDRLLSPCTGQLQPYLMVNYIIALQGTFPSRK